MTQGKLHLCIRDMRMRFFALLGKQPGGGKESHSHG